MTKGKLKSAKRFGVRYGATVKHKFADIEEEQRKKHICPYCRKLKVKRTSFGIWTCRKCNATFTSKAYTVSKPRKITEETKETVVKAEA